MRTLVTVIASLFVALFLAQTAAAQKPVSFPSEDGGVIYADVQGESARAVVLALIRVSLNRVASNKAGSNFALALMSK